MLTDAAGAGARHAANADQRHVTGDALRSGLAAAAQVGPVIAALRDPLPGTGQGTAARNLSLVQDSRWWQDATAEEIIAAFEVACSGPGTCPLGRRAAERIRAEVMARYQVDVLRPCASPAAVQAALAERARTEREAAALDLTDAAQALARADPQARHHQPARDCAELERGIRLYSSAERRRRLAERIDPRPAPP